MKTIEELIDYLSKLRKGDYQRDNFDKFLKAVKFSYMVPSIHVAGSNGKGSTSNFIQNIFQEAKLKVGFYHSPYLLSPLENIAINGNFIDLSDFCKVIDSYEKEIKKFNLSEFELETFIALTYFSKEKCDVAVIECGMGGEFDATNIFNPILSVITSVSLEHTMFLGDSLSEVASHKAGIIKKYVPVCIGDIKDDALEVIARKAKEMEAPIISPIHVLNKMIDEEHLNLSYEPIFKSVDVKFNSLYLVKDLEIAMSAILSLKDRFHITNEDIKNGIMRPLLPGRMQIVCKSPLIFVDGSHNPEGIRALKESIESLNLNKPIHVIYASFKDKNINSILPTLNTLSLDISLTTFDHPRARKEDEYFMYLDDYKFEEDYISLINHKIEEYKDEVILITGSLAFSGLVLKAFKDGDIKC